MIFWSCGSGWIGRDGGKKATRMRKCNYASYVKINPPHGFLGRSPRNKSHPIFIAACRGHSRGLWALRLCLTFYMRLNYYYTPERPHGQTPPARPEDRGTEANRHAQSACGHRDRSPVPTEPLLRSPRSSAGPLRDAATPHCRTDVDSRGRCRFWRFAPHVLSGPSVFPTIWTGRPIAGSAGAEWWTQAERRSSGLRGQFAGVRTPAHHRSVRESYSRTFCHYRPQTQSRASSGA